MFHWHKALVTASILLPIGCGKSSGGGSSAASTQTSKQTITADDLAETVTVAITDGAMKGTQAAFPAGTLAIGTAVEVKAITEQPTELATVFSSGVVMASPAGVELSVTDATGNPVQLASPGTLTIAINAVAGLAVDPTKDNIGVISKLKNESLIAYLSSQLTWSTDDTLPAIPVVSSGAYTAAFIGNEVPSGFKAYDAEAPYTESKVYTLAAGTITATSLVLSWEKAVDDATSQTKIKYKVVQSATDNISTLETALANGSTIMDWTADVSSFAVTGLTAETTYYFNVLIEDESKKARAYTKLAAATANRDRRMFLTNMDSFAGNLQGMSGADSFCGSDTAKPEGTATWKAFLVQAGVRVACTTANCSGGTSEHTDWVLKPNTTYTLAEGGTIGTTNAAGIFAFPLQSMLAQTTNYFWTGFAAAGDWTAGSNNCLNWTSANSGDNGERGRQDSTSNKILANAPTACNVDSRLLCVEQ
ncbi:MAG: DUF1554 domain-containing protein [Pseudobdellovibrionaceae bacterium]|nr:DUF1554 domain-containing protein [Pseudobdellovibrionaceae bacterium]